MTQHTQLAALRQQLQNVFIGQDAVVEQTLVCLLANGHLLLEGVPGLGKTLLVRALSKSMSLKPGRIQFTPDLLPSDVTGHTLYDMGASKFVTRPGPVFCNLLLADEINRAPAKTQSALLEVMQERQVTIEGRVFPLEGSFMVIATQNPIEQDGTYPLPEAELDRFLLKANIDYPDHANELALAQGKAEPDLNALDSVLDQAQLSALQQACAHIAIDEKLATYAVDIVRATRTHAALQVGAGPRASINLVKAAKARAMLHDRDYVIPDDIKQLAPAVLRHRVRVAAEYEFDGQDADQVIAQLISQQHAPTP